MIIMKFIILFNEITKKFRYCIFLEKPIIISEISKKVRKQSILADFDFSVTKSK